MSIVNSQFLVRASVRPGEHHSITLFGSPKNTGSGADFQLSSPLLKGGRKDAEFYVSGICQVFGGFDIDFGPGVGHHGEEIYPFFFLLTWRC